MTGNSVECISSKLSTRIHWYTFKYIMCIFIYNLDTYMYVASSCELWHTEFNNVIVTGYFTCVLQYNKVQ